MKERPSVCNISFPDVSKYFGKECLCVGCNQGAICSAGDCHDCEGPTLSCEERQDCEKCLCLNCEPKCTSAPCLACEGAVRVCDRDLEEEE